MRIRFSETNNGKWHSNAGSPKGRFSFNAHVDTEDIRRFSREGSARITGQASVEGLASDAPIDGTLTFANPAGDGLVYDFTFRAGKSIVRFLGNRRIEKSSPIKSFSTIEGELSSGGLPLGHATAGMDFATALRVLASLRPGL